MPSYTNKFMNKKRDPLGNETIDHIRSLGKPKTFEKYQEGDCHSAVDAKKTKQHLSRFLR